ncbi:hypothetical protein ACQP1W_36415 [Spirillospora sp. CA-255316]
MDNTVRWTLFAALLVVNVVTGAVAEGSWYQIVISAVTGAGMLALAVDYLVRGRRRD